MTAQIKLGTFIAQAKITMTVEWANENPIMDADSWARSATHWRCIFRRGRKRLTTYFSQGSAHIDEPKMADVLDCLASDSASIENARSFEDWCADFGYDTDSRKAERTWRACQEQAAKLKSFLGPAYETLLWNVERS